MTRKNAIILNYTANTYHWGCYGTCTEVRQTLAERGYAVNWLDVRTTHRVEPTPVTVGDFDDAKFASTFFNANRAVYHALTDADVVVVNGEGTLHRANPGPLNLLFLMYACRKFLGKPVHLINHSFFPTGSEKPEERIDALYRGVATTLSRVVPRETASADVLRRLGIAARQGFDCLPRFIARHGVTGATSPAGPLVLSGGITLDPAAATRIARALAPFAANGRRLCFLMGAKSHPAPEDKPTYEAMRAGLPQLELIEAADMAGWLQTLASASCVVSARYHHTIAAATLGTPVIAFPSNTPKVSAICAMFGIEPPLSLDGYDWVEILQTRIQRALNGAAACVTEKRRAEVIALAEQNFEGL